MNLRRLLIWGTGLLVVLVLGSAVWDIWRARGRSIQEAQSDLENLARALAGQTAQSIDTVDVLLADIAELVRQHALTRERLHDKLVAVSAVDSLAVFDGNGTLVASASDGRVSVPAAPPDFAGVTGDLTVTPGPVDAAGDLWLLVSHRIRSDSGAPTATIVATMDAQHFQDFFSAILLPRDGLVNLYRRDGTLLVRVPSMQGTPLAQEDPPFGAALARGAPAFLRVVTPWDKITRMIALRPVDGLPLVVGVGISERAVLASWYERSRSALARNLVMSAALVGLTVGVLRQLRRREAVDARLRRSEAYLAEAQRLSHTGNWAENFLIGTFEASPEALRIFGYSGEEKPTLEGFRNRIHPEDLSRTEEAAAKGKRDKTDFEVEHRILWPDGSVRHVHCIARPVVNESGDLVEMFGTIVDITERKRADAELRASESRHRHIFQAVGVSIWEEDFSRVKAAIDDLKAEGIQDFRQYVDAHPDFVRQALAMVRLVDVNEATLRLFGAQSKEDLLVSLDRVFTPETCEVFAGELIAVAEGRTWFEAETVLRTLQGDQIAVLFKIIFPPPPSALETVLVSITDITERKGREERLRAQAALLDLAHDALIVRGQNDVITGWNKGAERIYGWSRDEAIGKVSHDLLRTRFPAPLEEVERELDSSGHWQGELTHYRKDGAQVIADSRWTVQRDGQGRITRRLETNNDITERKLALIEQAHLEQRLREAEKLEALGTLAGGIAHDFNNILGAILGYGNMVHGAAPEGTALQRHAGNVLAAAQRAKALVDQILGYSRSQRGPRNPVDVRAVVSETLDLLRASLRESIQLEAGYDAGALVVLCDPTQVHQIVMNLCTNAMQAMPGSGTLRVNVSRQDLPTGRSFSHGTLLTGAYVQVMVADTGMGMDADLLKRVFEPFFTTKEPGAGTGLGLALVHNIVAELGGAIDVQSAPGQGSAFCVYLPRFDEPGVEAAADSALKRGSGQPVMVVEDDKSLLLLAEEMLAALGYEPAGFSAAHEAIDALAAAPSQFDAAVIDYVLPGMTGIELTRRLRQHRVDLPVILLSGYRGPMLYQEAKAAGIAQVLAKPVTAAALGNALVDMGRHLESAHHPHPSLPPRRGEGALRPITFPSPFPSPVACPLFHPSLPPRVRGKEHCTSSTV